MPWSLPNKLMINFSESYISENFQIFLKDFLPNDYIKKIEEIEIDEKNNYFNRKI